MRLPRRPLAFSLRTLMALVTIASFWLAWVRSHVLERRAAINDWMASDSGIAWRHVYPDIEPSGPPDVHWVRRCFGDRAVLHVSISTENGRDVFDRAKRLFPEATVQWAMIASRDGLMTILPLPSRDHAVYLSPSGPVVIEP